MAITILIDDQYHIYAKAKQDDTDRLSAWAITVIA